MLQTLPQDIKKKRRRTIRKRNPKHSLGSLGRTSNYEKKKRQSLKSLLALQNVSQKLFFVITLGHQKCSPGTIL